MKILECGAGPGLVTEYTITHMPANCSVVATDISPNMIEICTKNLKCFQEKMNNLQIMVADAMELPFGDQEFDRYYSNLTLQLVPDHHKMLREARRVLRPGGIAAFTVWGRTENSPLFTLISQGEKKIGAPKKPGL
jgi:ubiquinone/menaquinone biosynthesis C-methylase UbiE